MVICKFFQQGNCRFGDRCRFEHPKNFTQPGQNRYGPLQNSELGGSRNVEEERWSINIMDVRNDLAEGRGRPNWILSAYGPGKAPPASLLKNLEWSPEELRVDFYEQAALGSQDVADQRAIRTWNEALHSIKNQIDDASSVPKLMLQAEQDQPNRNDMCTMTGKETVEEFLKTAPASPSFARNGANLGREAFGQPAFGQSGFGGNQQTTPSFGQQSAKATFGSGMFGQPASGSSGFGQPAFGSTGFGQARQNPFAPASASAGFGQGPSSFGQPSQLTSTFVQPTQAAPAFGQPSQPSAFGQTSQLSSPFGQPSQASPAFGQPPQPASAFGQSSQPATVDNPFGQSAQHASTASGFGQPSQPSSGFGQPAFGSSSAPAFGSGAAGSGTFGDGAARHHPFGPQDASAAVADRDMNSESRPPSSRDNPFGRPADSPAPFGALKPTDAPRSGSISTEPLRPHPTNSSTAHPLTNSRPAALTYTQTLPDIPPQRTSNGRLSSYRGQNVQYIQDLPDKEIADLKTTLERMIDPGEKRKMEEWIAHNNKQPTFYPCYRRPDGKGLEKIWFPDGGGEKDVMYLSRADKREDLEADEEAYTDEIKEQYAALHRTGMFKDGKMPSVPPMREWVDYDF